MLMKPRDIGPHVISVLALAWILAALIGIGLPVIKSKGETDLADWLGLSGSLLNTFVTAVAIYFAYRAVTKQIDAQVRIANAPTEVAWNEFRQLLNLVLYDVHGLWRAVE